MLAALGAFYLFVRIRRKRLPESVWFYRALALAGPASVVALIAGWVTTEVGRQPWVVYKVMLTDRGRHRRQRHPRRLRHAGRSSTSGSAIGVVWILRRLARMPMDPPAAGRAAANRRRRSDASSGDLSVHLYELPLIFVLIGLVFYAVLAGADFGAGFWQLFAGPERTRLRVREHAHESMAPVWEANHVWLIFVLTVTWTAYPTRVRLDRLDAVDPAVHRRHRDRPARRRLRAASRHRDRPRAAVDRHGLRPLLDPHAVRARHDGRRDRLAPRVPGRQRRRDTCSRAGRDRPRSSSACWPSPPPPTSPPCSSPPTPPASADRELEDGFRRRALAAGRARRRGRARRSRGAARATPTRSTTACSTATRSRR